MKNGWLTFGKQFELIIREFKLHVNGKRQASDSSWEFLKIENAQIETAPNNSYGLKIAWNY